MRVFLSNETLDRQEVLLSLKFVSKTQQERALALDSIVVLVARSRFIQFQKPTVAAFKVREQLSRMIATISQDPKGNHKTTTIQVKHHEIGCDYNNTVHK